jgi:hypothetical protein
MTVKDRFVADRANALAIVLLTRRRDLSVVEKTTEKGLDYIVTIGSGRGIGERTLGIDLAAVLTPLAVGRANRKLKSKMARIKSIGPFLYPVCVFLFAAKSDQGYYTWAYEPVVGNDGVPTLKNRSEAHCRELNDDSLEAIVDQVNRWYDAYYSKMVS